MMQPTSSETILNFSDSWNCLYRAYTWPSPEEIDVPNSRPNNFDRVILTRNHRNKSFSYDKYFLPATHSTPNNILSKNSGHYDITAENSSSIDSMSNSSSYQNSILGIEYFSNATQIEDLEVGTNVIVPTISNQVEQIQSRKYISNEICCEQRTNQKVRKFGIKGIRCIVSFALDDNVIKTRTHIQACSITVMILAIIIISFLLVHLSNNYSVNTSKNIVLLPTNSSVVPASTESHFHQLVTNSTESNFVSYETTTEVLYQPSNTTLGTENSIIYNLENNGGDWTVDNNTQADENTFCSCEPEQICMLDNKTGTAVCFEAVDVQDPSGCGGLCSVETEACRMVDRARGVRECRSLSPTTTCSAEQWRCHNGICIQNTKRCDGQLDCYDKSDELHCDCDLSKSFRCGQSTSCFLNMKRCDGNIDCWDGSDERNCTKACPEGQYTCNSGQCIPNFRFCDGLSDCLDSSDEPEGCDQTCASNEMKCNNSRCVFKSARCDGFDHCGDNTDEIACP